MYTFGFVLCLICAVFAQSCSRPADGDYFCESPDRFATVNGQEIDLEYDLQVRGNDFEIQIRNSNCVRSGNYNFDDDDLVFDFDNCQNCDSVTSNCNQLTWANVEYDDDSCNSFQGEDTLITEVNCRLTSAVNDDGNDDDGNDDDGNDDDGNDDDGNDDDDDDDLFDVDDDSSSASMLYTSAVIFVILYALF